MTDTAQLQLLEAVADAFARDPQCDPSDVAHLLDDAGWPPPLARRAIAFVPLAFGREFLRDDPPHFWSTIQVPDPDTGRSARADLGREPLYALSVELARSWRAQGRTRDFDAVANRSAEVFVVRQLDDVSPSDIVLVEPVLPGIRLD